MFKSSTEKRPEAPGGVGLFERLAGKKWRQREDYCGGEKISNGANPNLKHTFPKEEKLRKKKEFTALFKKGRVYTGRDLQLFVLPRPDGLRKAAFVFSRRVKSSVQRNRVRRLLRQAYRQNKERFSEGYSLLLRVNRSPKTAGLALIEAEFLDLARRAGILKLSKPGFDSNCFT